MATHKSLPFPSNVICFLLFLSLTITSVAAARNLDEEEPAIPTSSPGVTGTVVSSASNVATPAAAVTAAGAATVPAAGAAAVPAAGAAAIPAAGAAAVPAAGAAAAITADSHHTLTFFMHDIIGGSNPSTRAVTGIVSNPAINGQIPFTKTNAAVIPVDNGVPVNSNNNGIINNNNLPFLTGLGGNVANAVQNNGNNNINGRFGIPLQNGAPLQSGATIQKLMFGTLTVIDDELTEGHELGSGLIGKAQGFYVASSVDGLSHTMAFTALFVEGGYEDSISFFGVHRTAVSESQLAIMGGTGKYVNAKGFATVKTFPAPNQHTTDGIETLLQFIVYLA